MLSYEDAMYHKLLLEADVKGELRPVIDRLLAEEEPLSDVALALAYARDDANKQLSALNEYLSKADEAEIDMETIRNKLMEYFRGRYEKDPDDIGELVGLMSHVGMDSELSSTERALPVLFLRAAARFAAAFCRFNAIFFENVKISLRLGALIFKKTVAIVNCY